MSISSFFKNILVLAWLSSLLVSTTGVSVHRLYCFCKKESAITFLFHHQMIAKKSPPRLKTAPNLPRKQPIVAPNRSKSHPKNMAAPTAPPSFQN
jgi:hypothetical protein